MKGILFALLVNVMATLSWSLPARAEEAAGAVEGYLFAADGAPAREAVILFFDADQGPPPKPAAYWRLPDGGGPIDDRGHFLVNLPPGQYWYGAIKRPRERKGQQPRLENWLYLGREQGVGLARVTVEAGQTTALPELKGAGPLTTSGNDEEAVHVTGTVKEGSGKPVVGFVVEAFASQGAKARPLFSSDHLGSDGSFALNLPPGRYELQLRALAGPAPAPHYQFTEPATIEAGDGISIAPLDLRVLVKAE